MGGRIIRERGDFWQRANYSPTPSEYEKSKGSKIDIADDPELQRHKQNTRVQSQAQYHGELQKKQQQEANRPASELANRVGAAAAESGGPLGVLLRV